MVAVSRRVADVDCMEIQLTNRVLPDAEDLAALEELCGSGATVALSPLALEDTGKVHLRSRTGYRPSELPRLDQVLGEHGLGIDRAVCMVDDSESVWTDILAFNTELGAVGGLDFLVPLGADDDANTWAAAEALFAGAHDARLPHLPRPAAGS